MTNDEVREIWIRKQNELNQRIQTNALIWEGLREKFKNLAPKHKTIMAVMPPVNPVNWENPRTHEIKEQLHLRYQEKLIEALYKQNIDSFVQEARHYLSQSLSIDILTPALDKEAAQKLFKIEPDIQTWLVHILTLNYFPVERIVEYFLATGEVSGKDLLAWNFKREKYEDSWGINAYLFSQGHFLTEDDFNDYFFEEKTTAMPENLEQLEQAQALFMGEQQRILDKLKLKNSLNETLNIQPKAENKIKI